MRGPAVQESFSSKGHLSISVQVVSPLNPARRSPHQSVCRNPPLPHHVEVVEDGVEHDDRLRAAVAQGTNAGEQVIELSGSPRLHADEV